MSCATRHTHTQTDIAIRLAASMMELSMTASPLIIRAEQLYELTDALSKLGYQSVFDVVRVPRERFVRQHRDSLGRNAGRIYDLLIGDAHQVVHQIRHTRVARAVNSALHGPFSTSGPDYANQFPDTQAGWKDKAPSGALEANDGPVAYLAYIYERALQEEKNGAGDMMNSLKERRPDIGSLLIDDEAINKEIPQIQLVNEVLASAIQSRQKLGDLSGVNQLLATTRYPNTLPYDYEAQQIRAAEAILDISLQDYLLPQGFALEIFWSAQSKLTDSQVSYLTRLQIMASALASAQQQIITEPPYFPSDNGDTDTKTKFYDANFGDGSLSATRLASMDELTSRTGLTVPDVEKMLCVTAGGSTVVASDNAKYIGDLTASAFGAKFVHAGSGPLIYLTKGADDTLQVMSLTDDRLDRINRIVRLQKWLDLPFEDIDLLVTSTMKAEDKSNSALLMNDNTLRMLGMFKQYKKLYNVSAKQFAAWLSTVTPFAITPEKPFLDQIFNSSGAFDSPFVVDPHSFEYMATSGPDAALIEKISTALRLNHRQFLMFAAEISSQQGIGSRTLDLTLPTVGAFYRLASLARALEMSPEDFYALVQVMDQGTRTVWKQLAGAQPIVSAPQNGSSLLSDFLTLLQAFSHVVQWLRTRQLSGRAALTMATSHIGSQSSVQGTAYQLAFIQEVWQQLMNTLADPTLFKGSGAPLVDDNGEPIDWKQLLSGSDKLIDGTGLITDAADVTVSVTIDGAATTVVKLISDVVNAQALADDEKKQAMLSLNATVIQARQTQTGVTTSLLAKTLDVTQSLSTLVLRWAQETPYQWLKATWALKGTVKTAADIPSSYLNSLQEIARCALLCQQFSLSPVAVEHLLDHPDRFGLPSRSSSDVTFGALYMLSRYDDLLHQIGGSGNGTEDDLLAYLQTVNSASPPSTPDVAQLLATLLGWAPEEVEDSWTVLGDIAKTVPQLDVVMRLQQAQRDTGLTVSQQQQAFDLDREMGQDAWQAVGQAMVAGANHVKGAG